jgi:hypothetical protein
MGGSRDAPCARVVARQARAFRRKLLAACEKRIVRWDWATRDRWPSSPFLFERLKLTAGSPLARAPKAPKRDTCAVAFDAEDRMVAKRVHTSTGITEELFEHHGDVVDSYYFFVGVERCTVTRHWYRKGRLIRLAHTYDDGDVNDVRFAWKGDRMVKVTSRGAGHDYDELLEHDKRGLRRVTRVHRDGLGGSDVVYRRT